MAYGITSNMLQRRFGGVVAGGSSFVPSDIAGLEEHYDAAFKTLNGADVSDLLDQSGNTRDCSQGTASKQPLYVASGLNSLPSVEFDGVEENLQSAAFTLDAQPDTMFLVVDVLAATNGVFEILVTGGAVNRQVIAMDFGTPTKYTIGSTSNVASSTTATTGGQIIAAQFNSPSSAMYKDGTSILSSATTGTTGIDTITLGSSQSEAIQFGNFRLSEFIRYDSLLSNANMNLVGNYLASKYALTWNDL